MKPLHERSAREHADYLCQHVDGTWETKKAFTIHRHDYSRFSIEVQQLNCAWQALARSDAIDGRYEIDGVSSMERDANEFTQDFVNLFVPHISMRELECLISALTAEKDRWEEDKKSFSEFLETNKGTF